VSLVRNLSVAVILMSGLAIFSLAKSQPNSHLRTIKALEYSPSGELLVSAGLDNSVKVWQTSTGKLLNNLSSVDQWIVALAASPDQKSFISTSQAGFVRQWKVTDGSLIRTTSVDPGTETLAVSKEREFFATGGKSRRIQIGRTRDLKPFKILEGHEGSIQSLAFFADGAHLFSSGGDQTIRTWDYSRNLACRELISLDSVALVLKISPDGRFLVAGTSSGDVMAWQLRDLTQISSCEVVRSNQPRKRWNQLHSGPVSDLCFSADGVFLLTGGNDGVVNVLVFEDGSLQSTNRFSSPVRSVLFMPDRKSYAAGLEDGLISIMRSRDSQGVMTTNTVGGPVVDMELSPNGTSIISATFGAFDSRPLKQHRIEKLGPANPFSAGGLLWIHCLAFSSDDRLLAAGDLAGKILIWDLHEGVLLKILKGHNRSVTAVAFSPDNRQLVSADSDSMVRLWDISAGEAQSSWVASKTEINRIAWTPKGTKIISTDIEGTASTWDVKQSRMVDRRRMSGTVEGILFTSPEWEPNDTRVSTDSFFGITLLLAGSERKGEQLVSHSRDGSALAIRDEQNRIHIWSTKDPDKKSTLNIPYSDKVRLSPDGEFIASDGEDGRSIRIWTCNGDLVANLEDVSHVRFEVHVEPKDILRLHRSETNEIRLIASPECGSKNDFRCITREGNLILQVISEDGRKIRLDRFFEGVRLVSSGRPLSQSERAFVFESQLAIGLSGGLDLAAEEEIRVTGLELSSDPTAFNGGTHTELRYNEADASWKRKSFFLPLFVYPRAKAPVKYLLPTEPTYLAQYTPKIGVLGYPEVVDHTATIEPGKQSSGWVDSDLTSITEAASEYPSQETERDSDQPVFKAAVNVVRVDCRVQNRRGEYMNDLSQGDFQVFENGNSRQIRYFRRALSPGSLPAAVVLLIDSSGSVIPKFAFEQQVVADFLGDVLRPTIDQAAMVQFGSEVALAQEFTSDIGLLKRTVHSLRAEGSTQLYDGIWLSIKELLRDKDARRILVVLSDGNDTMSVINQQETRRIAQDEGVTVFAVGVKGPYEIDFSVLKDLAKATGGSFLDANSNPKELADAFSRIVRSVQAQYTIGYLPEGSVLDPGFHRIEIKLKKRGLDVTHRSGYYVQ